MSNDNTYNGWKNYATWRINLEVASDLCDSLIQDREKFDSLSELAQRIEDDVDTYITQDDSISGLAVDYARAFVSDVDWYEIASHYEDDLIRSDEQEDEDEDCDDDE